MQDIRDWIFDHLPVIVIGGGLAALLVLLFWAESVDAAQWKAFSQAHRCRLVSTSPGTTVPIYGGRNGVNFAYVSGKDGFLCDDGVVHYRDN